MTQTLFIGLDGATFTALDQLTQPQPEGGVVMPFLKQLMEGGARANLLSTPNPLTPPGWVSIMTGHNPGSHGVYDFIRTQDQGDDVYFTLSDARDIRHELIWSIISQHDQSVVALNFPFTAPPKPINGALVPGFVPWKHLRRNTYPNDLYDRLKAIPEFNAKELAWDFEREKKAGDFLSDEELVDWIAYHIPRDKQWYLIASTLLKEDNPNLMAVVFDGVDKLQHQAWRFIDPSVMPANPTPVQQKIRALCLEYFQKLDGYIQGLVEQVGPDTQIVLASDHGFTVSTEIVRINTFLAEKGYLFWQTTDDSEASKRREASWFANLDWDRTLAYCQTPSGNGITIRVAKNPGDPGVPAADYESFRDQLIADLKTLTHPENGEPIIQAAHKREDIYSGDAVSEAPDLTLVLRDYGFVSIKNVEPVVELRQVPSGTHHPDGIFIAAGPGVKAGFNGPRRRLVDVSATLLYSLGLPIPQDFEGGVPEEFFDPAYFADHPVAVGSAATASTQRANDEDISEDEKEKILAQLQMLGYLE